MKKYARILPFAMAMVMLAGCSDDMSDELGVNAQKGGVLATIEDNPTTRTAVKESAEGKSIVWAGGDAFKVFNKTNPTSPATLTLSSGAGTANGTFGGSFNNSDTYEGAAFPAVNAVSLSGNTLTMTIPSTFAWGKETANDADAVKVNLPFYGTYDQANSSVSFKFLTAAIKFDFKDIPSGTNKITIVSANEPISGSFTADVSVENPVLASSSTNEDDKKMTITFEALTVKGDKVLYMPIPAGTFTDLKVYLGEATGGKLIASWENITFERKYIYTATRTYVEINASTPQQVSNQLKEEITATEAGQKVEVVVKSTNSGTGIAPSGSDTSDEIKIPQVEGTDVSLTFEEIPNMTDALKIVQEAVEGQTVTSNSLTVSMPDNASSSEGIELNINLPNTTVTLESTGTTGTTYKTVTAKTATNTLVVGDKVTITSLKIEAGNVKLLKGGTITNVPSKAAGSRITVESDELSAIASFVDEVVLSGNVTVNEPIEIAEDANLTLNLNGKTINGGSVSGYTGHGLFKIQRGATLKVDGTAENSAINSGSSFYSPFVVTVKDDNAEKTATLEIEGGTYTGVSAAISGNGTRNGTSITVKDAKLTASDGPAIYHPQAGTLTVSGASELTGTESAIEMRSGTLVVNGGTYTSTAESFSATANGNGTTIKGAAIAVSQHTTNQTINITINGGTFDGKYALYEADLQDNTTNVEMSVSGGTFNGDVYSKNCANFITAGTFTDPMAFNYASATSDITVNVASDKELTTPIVVKGKGTLNMNGKTFSNISDIWNDAQDAWSFVSVQGSSADLTISGNGTFQTRENDCYAIDVRDGGTLTIEDGTFVGNITSIYLINKSSVENSTAYIKGGEYRVQQKYPDANKPYAFTLNCYDASYTTGKAKFVVSGGRFYKFNPGATMGEPNGPKSFLADGYSSTQEGDYFVVSATSN